MKRLQNITYWAHLILLLSLPFEGIRPVFETPWLVISSLELVFLPLAGAALLLGASWLLQNRLDWKSLRSLLRQPLHLPALLFILLAFLAALLAPRHGTEALKAAGRLAAGLLLFWSTTALAQDAGRRRGMLLALLTGALLSGLLGLAEAISLPMADPLLALFKAAPSQVAGALRVSASFQYATTAAAYFEIIAPLGLLLAAFPGPGRKLATVAGLLAIIVAALTLTRSTLLILAFVLGSLLILGQWQRGWRPIRSRAAAGLLLLLAAGAFTWWQSPVVRTRLTTEDTAEWYGALYQAPEKIEFASGSTTQITFSAANSGRLVWENEGEHPTILGYYWLNESGTAVFQLPVRTLELPHVVRPGESVAVQVPLSAELPPGKYRLALGLWHHGVSWFRYRDVPEWEMEINVTPGAKPFPTLPASEPRGDPAGGGPPVLSRRQLWAAAVQLWWERPLRGHGPHTFRLLHGSVLGLESWDQRVNANQLYLELLADTGLPGLAAFVWLVLAACARLWQRLRSGREAQTFLWLGLAAGLAAFLLHGLLDYFLETLALNLLFWFMLGLTAGGSGRENGEPVLTGSVTRPAAPESPHK